LRGGGEWIERVVRGEEKRYDSSFLYPDLLVKRLVLASLTLVASAAQAQDAFSVRSVNAQPGGSFGTVVAAVADLNADGVSDLLVGAHGEWWNGIAAGRAYIHSGADGALLYAFRSPTPQADGAFGIAVAGLGDVDADGRADVAVGAPVESGGGRVHLFSGATGAFIRTLSGGTGAVAFGYAIADAGDVDADGAADVLVGDYKRLKSGLRVGTAQILSGRTGAVLRTLLSPSAEDDLHFGRALAAGRDLTGDGVPDIAVAARNENLIGTADGGRVHLFDGTTGELVRSLESPAPSVGGQFGLSVALCPDLDGDGTGDVVVGAGRESGPAFQSGRAYVFSGKTGALVHARASPIPAAGGWFGQNAACIGDVTGDGLPDIGVGAVGEAHGAPSSGAIHVFSGRSGRAVARLVSPAAEEGGRFGIFVAPVTGTASGATRAVAAGAYYEDAPDVDAGAVHVQAVVNPVQADPAPASAESRVGLPVPNPTSTRTTLALDLATAADVDVTVTDARGRTVAQQVPARLSAGTHRLTVETAGLAPGTYVARVRIGRHQEVRRFVVVR
jgi:hypothetical protein